VHTGYIIHLQYNNDTFSNCNRTLELKKDKMEEICMHHNQSRGINTRMLETEDVHVLTRFGATALATK